MAVSPQTWSEGPAAPETSSPWPARRRALLTFVLYYGTWSAAVTGGAAGYWWLGPLASLPLLGLCFRWVPARAGLLRLLLAVLVLGTVVDAALMQLGLLTFEPSGPVAWLPSPWMSALWVIFAATMPLSLSWTFSRPLLSAALGAAFAPGSYIACRTLGALGLGDRPTLTLVVLAALWSLIMAWLAGFAPRALALTGGDAAGR